MELNKIAVIGAGTMGNGIAQVCAASGLDVLMTDISEAALQRGVAATGKSLERLVARQKLGEGDKAATLAPIRTATALEAVADRDLVIEAATENVDLKLKIKPQIHEGDMVRMDIEESQEEIVEQNPTLGPTTAKRSVKTKVVVKDQSTIVIGGLVQDH